MNVEIITSSGSDLMAVNAARCSFDKESEWETAQENGVCENALKDKDAKLIDYLARNKHYAPFEHLSATLRLKVPLFIARQIQRHRTFAYSEVSRRYVKDNLELYYPDKWRRSAENVKQGSSDEEVSEILVTSDKYVARPQIMATAAVNHALFAYEALVKGGVCAEQARMVLPQNLYTTFWMTGNLRNWIHFVKLRTDAHAQREVQEVGNKVLDILRELYPSSVDALMKYE